MIELAERFGHRERRGVHVKHDLTQEEIAQLVGPSPETVNKALADLATRGWIRSEGKSVLIFDIERVARRGGVTSLAESAPGLRHSPTDTPTQVVGT